MKPQISLGMNLKEVFSVLDANYQGDEVAVIKEKKRGNVLHVIPANVKLEFSKKNNLKKISKIGVIPYEGLDCYLPR